MDYADRRLQKSQKELASIKRGLGRAAGDQKKMTKELKKIRKYFRSLLLQRLPDWTIPYIMLRNPHKKVSMATIDQKIRGMTL